MAYNITLTNGQNLVTIADGTADTSYTSLTLFGKNYAGYGPLQDENFVKMLENFAFSSPPPNPLQGQLWWDAFNKQMKVRVDQEWKVISSPTATSASPANSVVGELWWDATNKQLSAYNGTDWTLVGPAYKAGQGLSGALVTDVIDANHMPHTVIEFYSSGVPMAVLSKDPTFTSTIPGFTTIKTGFNLPTSSTSQYHGDAENALSLGNVLAANYLRSDVASVTNFPLSVKTNTGLTVGASDDMTIGVTGSATSFVNNTAGRDVSFFINQGGPSLALNINGTTGLVTVPAGDPTAPAGVATKNYVDTKINTASAALLHIDGTNALIGNIHPNGNHLYSLGDANNGFDFVFAREFDATTVNSDTGTFNTIQVNDAPTAQTSATNRRYVDSSVSSSTSLLRTEIQSSSTALIGGAPASLNTLGKLATAVNNNPAFGADILARIATLAPLDSADLIGSPSAPTAPVSDVSSRIATTSYVASRIATELSGLAADNPEFTGTMRTNIILTNGGIITETTNQIDIGSTANPFRKFYGTSVSAAYADLAENYVADAQYEPGNVLCFGGANEVTIGCPGSTAVAGVVSTSPGYLMNDTCQGQFVVAIALQGRVPTKVMGPVKKGDLLVSAGTGYASACKHPTVGMVIGKALQDLDDDFGVIEVAIGRC